MNARPYKSNFFCRDAILRVRQAKINTNRNIQIASKDTALELYPLLLNY